MAAIDATAQGMASTLTWWTVARKAEALRERHPSASMAFGVPQGGIPVAALTGLPLVSPAFDPTPENLLDAYGDSLLVVDDLVDSGRTLQPYFDEGLAVDALFRKPHSPASLAPYATETSEWITFPWERGSGPEDAVVRLLEWIGENPNREGLLDTPKRVVKAFREMTSGLHQEPASVLGGDQPAHVVGIGRPEGAPGASTGMRASAASAIIVIVDLMNLVQAVA